ncbi:DUF6434 domain-containing protein [Marinobacter salexigens]|uniref:DUF6434 domain-containing protein n=1 Tax=Marinobacter salexigens TaxID=1925763 RepID=UPI002090E9D5|nr:DUF6434 domain-containing protein [Marinobacter salexigens]
MRDRKLTVRESAFDWHSDHITESTPVTSTYRNTQNVRRFLQGCCGSDFRFDREFMAWIKNGEPKTMGEVAIEWRQRSKRKG